MKTFNLEGAAAYLNVSPDTMRGFPLREINDGGFQGDSFR